MTSGRSIALVAALTVLAAACATRPPPAARADDAPASVAGAPEQAVWQVFHRSARLGSGRLARNAPGRALDAALEAWSGGALPLDALAGLVPDEGRLAVVASPARGPLADAVAERLRLVAAPARIVVTEADADAGEDVSAVVVVWRPGWEGGGVDDPLSAVERRIADAGWPSPQLVFADLFEPSIGSAAWEADTILAGSPRAVAFAARFTLEARASGRLPDARALAGSLGLSLERLAWRRLAVAGRALSSPGRAR